MSLGDFASMEDSVTQSFKKYNELLSEESLIREEIRTAVRELEEHARNLTNVIQAIHHPHGILRAFEISNKCTDLLKDTSSKIKNLAAKFDPLCYYKYHDQWRFTMQRLAFVVLFVGFINNNNNNNHHHKNNKNSQDNNDNNNIREDNNNDNDGNTSIEMTNTITSDTSNNNNINNNINNNNNESLFFMTHEECANVLGVTVDNVSGFHLELEDYLSGLLMLASELARLSTNAVSCGNFEWSVKIVGWVGRLDQGFRLLNLKNDHLRRKYDGLKYDLKRVEEVAYDLAIRGLK